MKRIFIPARTGCGRQQLLAKPGLHRKKVKAAMSGRRQPSMPARNMRACPGCRGRLPEGARRCPARGVSLWPPGFWRRLFGRGIPRTIDLSRTTRFRAEQIKVHDPGTGQVRVYGSRGEVPTEIRAQIERVGRGAGHASDTTKIAVTGVSGRTRTFNSVEEMPENLRRLYEQVRARDPR
jgi:hypothetical protein